MNEQLLKKTCLFRRLNHSQVKKCEAIIQEKVYPKNTEVISEGKPGLTMYIVKSGRVHISKEIEGKPHLLSILRPGDFFGEICLFDAGLRSATAVTIQETSLVEIEKDDFQRLTAKNPDIGYKILYSMMEEMARRLRHTDEGMKNFMLWIMAASQR